MMRTVPLLSVVILTAAAVPGQNAPLPREATGLTSRAAAPIEPPALVALRNRYAESIAASDRAVNAQWIVSLTALEKSRVSAGDYDGAERVRLRREQALSLASTDDGRLPVPLSSRELTNKGSGLALDETSGIVTLSSTGAFLEWDISGEFRGWYEVRLTHAVAGGSDRTADIEPGSSLPADRRAKKNDPDKSPSRFGGRVSFQNASNLSRGNTVLHREIVPTGGWKAWRTVSLGRFEVTGRIAKFKLIADDAAVEGLMHFKGLELIPVASPAPVENGSAKLAMAREVFDKQFRNLTQTATTRYRDGLSALEQQALRAKDTDAVVRVRDERARLLSPEKLALGPVNDSGPETVPITLEVADAFKCQYRGDTTLDSTRTSLTKLRPAGSATVTWRLAACNVGSGTYAVELRGRVPVHGGGSATLAAFGASSVAAGTPLKVTVDPVASPESRSRRPDEGTSPPAAVDRTLEPGVLVIGKGAETLTLTVTSLTHPDGWLMDLAGLTLTRARDPAPAKGTP